jgi:hypothetical protein
MKRLIVLLLAAITAFSCLYAQASKNPFTKLGYKKQVVYSSSKGEFDEFHDQESVVEIGSVYFNIKTNKVVGLISEDGKQKNVNPATTAMSVDPKCEKYYWISPYAYCLNNPLKFVDPDGKDARVAITGNAITISSNIYLYGNGATKAVASQMQQSIMTKWNNGSKVSGFDVKFDVNVNLYGGKEKSNPFLISESWNPSNRDNFIEVSSDVKRSYVLGGDEGEWRADGRNGQTLAQDNPAPHEFGHIVGLDDQYTDDGGANKGWENNIMGNSQDGKVEQRNVSDILKDAMKAYNIWSKDENNKGKTFNYEINP